MNVPTTEPTGRLTPREGEPTPRQVREALRALRHEGYDYTYKQAWALVRAAMRQQREADMKAQAYELLRKLFGPTPMEALVAAKREIERAAAHHRG